MAAKAIGRKEISKHVREPVHVHVTQGTETISQKAGKAPRTVYRLIHPIVFQRDSHADSIVIQKDALRLHVEFFPLIYDALATDKVAPAAKLASMGGFAHVTMDAPRTIHRLRVADAIVNANTDHVDLHRVDGTTPAKDATTSAAISSGDYFYVPTDPDFVTSEFAANGKADGVTIAMDKNSLFMVEVRSYPSAPRIGLSKKGDEDTVTFFSIPPDDPLTRDKFAAALDLMIKSWPKPLPLTFEISLIFESDAPCTVTIQEFVTKHHQVIESFLVGTERKTDKQTLRFAAGKSTTQTLDLGLPSGAKVASASLKTVQSLGKDKFTSAGTGASADLSQKDGICLNADRGAAQLFQLTEPATLTGLALGLLALEDKTHLALELREDHNGQPTGRKAAEGAAGLGIADSRDWITFQFKEPAALVPGSYWLVVKAGKGSAVWLADSGDPAVFAMARDDPKEPLKLRGQIKGLRALYRAISRDEPSQGGGVAQSINATLAGVSLTPIATKDSVTYDLKPALDAHPGAGSVISFTSGLPGFATVYPPHIEYEM
jgi:hypothetical protein